MLSPLLGKPIWLSEFAFVEKDWDPPGIRYIEHTDNIAKVRHHKKRFRRLAKMIKQAQKKGLKIGRLQREMALIGPTRKRPRLVQVIITRDMPSNIYQKKCCALCSERGDT